MMRPTTSDNSRTISRNTFWYAFDTSWASIVMLIASVPVARVMGPDVLGKYVYLLFVTNVAQRLGNVGIPATSCKYIAEYLGRGELGLAREIFRVTLRQQALIAAAITLGGLLLVQLFTEPDLKLVAFLIVSSMLPAMINNIPAQANVAAEDMRANVPANLTYCVANSLLVISSLVFHWGLTGLAAATLVSRTMEAVVRYVGVRRWMRTFPPTTISRDLRTRMFTFSRQNLVLLALGLIVWDRSELLVLKYFSGVQQIAFYSLAFSIVNQLQMVPRAFAASVGMTIFAQYGRDRTALARVTDNATRYVSLIAVPMFLGLSVVAGPLIHLAYGSKYLAVIPVVWVLSLFSIPRAFQIHLEHLLQAMEHQTFLVKWLVLSGVANVLLDVLLIPQHGAFGAAIANGIAQTLAVGGLWFKAKSVAQIQLPLRFLRRLAVCGAAILLVVPVEALLPPAAALVVQVLLGALAFAVAVRATKCLEPEDLARFTRLANHLPPSLRDRFARGLRLVIAGESPTAASVPLTL